MAGQGVLATDGDVPGGRGISTPQHQRQREEERPSPGTVGIMLPQQPKAVKIPVASTKHRHSTSGEIQCVEDVDGHHHLPAIQDLVPRGGIEDAYHLVAALSQPRLDVIPVHASRVLSDAASESVPGQERPYRPPHRELRPRLSCVHALRPEGEGDRRSLADEERALSSKREVGSRHRADGTRRSRLGDEVVPAHRLTSESAPGPHDQGSRFHAAPPS